MSRCNWCKYYLNLVHNNFNGYTAFDEYGYSLRIPFCSINCCLAFVNSDNTKSNTVIEKRVDWIYKNYNIRKMVIDAKNPKRLIVNGGDLSYDEYRDEFFCPNIEDNKNQKMNSPIYKEEDDENYNYYEYENYQEEENQNEQNNENFNDDNFDID